MAARFILIGGFLGAGKTTTIARLARMHQSQGKNVAIVVNDKAPELVDTLSLLSQGYQVAELAGTCFCGNVDELTAAVEGLRLTTPPDVVLAEPVGSCIDMVATVIEPLMQQQATRYEVAPYGVLLKPSHGLKILRNESNAGFSPQAAYLFRKQIEEADFVALNRIDQLTTAQSDELIHLLKNQYPDTPALRISARTGEGFETLVSELSRPGSHARRFLDVDYDAYAAGEAELGWLNAALILQGTESFAVDELLLELVEAIRGRLRTAGLEAAHLKVAGLWGGAIGVANLVSNDLPAELSRASEATVSSLHVTVNARVAGDPEQLSTIVRGSIAALAESRQLETVYQHLQSFRPGRPTRQAPLSTLIDGSPLRSAD